MLYIDSTVHPLLGVRKSHQLSELGIKGRCPKSAPDDGSPQPVESPVVSCVGLLTNSSP